MFAWGLVTGAHALITNKQGYLACKLNPSNENLKRTHTLLLCRQSMYAILHLSLFHDVD